LKPEWGGAPLVQADRYQGKGNVIREDDNNNNNIHNCRIQKKVSDNVTPVSWLPFFGRTQYLHKHDKCKKCTRNRQKLHS
jgi:hypothetical protein